jgi:type IV secretory pathway VirB2 component (pilin)
VTADKNEQTIVQDDFAAKAIAAVIIAGILLMFGYTLLHWVIFE